MKNYDPSTEQQVWQRVLAGKEVLPRSDLRQLQQEAVELAAIYRSLTTRLSGRGREWASRLYTGEKSNAACLAGIGILSRQREETLKHWEPGKEEPEKLLQQCYHRSRRCMMEYMARSVEGEWGVVFERMAKREGEHCTIIAEMLGSFK